MCGDRHTDLPVGFKDHVPNCDPVCGFVCDPSVACLWGCSGPPDVSEASPDPHMLIITNQLPPVSPFGNGGAAGPRGVQVGGFRCPLAPLEKAQGSVVSGLSFGAVPVS